MAFKLCYALLLVATATLAAPVIETPSPSLDVEAPAPTNEETVQGLFAFNYYHSFVNLSS